MTYEYSDKHRRELIERIKNSVSFPSGLDPEKAFSAVMCTLSARLNRGESVGVYHSLTENEELRPFFESCATHRGGERGYSFGADQFYLNVAEHLKISESEAVDVTHAVLQSLHDWVPAKELKDIESELSKDLKAIRRAA